MAWWKDRIRIAATLSIVGWVIVLLVGISLIDPQGPPAFWSGWIKEVQACYDAACRLTPAATSVSAN